MLNDQEKTKEELIEELQKLQEAHNSLKAQCDKDINERKRDEEALKEGGERYRKFIEDNEAIILEVNPENGRIISANNSAVKFYGWEKEKLLQMNINQINTLPPDEIKAKIAEARKKEQNYFVFKHRTASGNILDVEVYQSKIRQKNEETFSLIIHDISERRQSEELLKSAEFKFRIFADYTYDWEYWEDENQKLVYISPSCQRITGYTSEEFISDPELLGSIVHPDDVDFVHKHHEKTYSFQNRNDLEELEFRIIKKDGSISTIYHSCSPIYNEDRRFLGRRVSNSDVTERKEAETSLQKSRERWESLFNNSPNAIAVYQAVDDGNDFVFTDFNLTAQITDNLKYDEVIGRCISELFPTADQLGLLDMFRKVWHTGKTEYLSSTFYKDNRIEGWRENIIYKLTTGEIVAIYNDVSDRKKAEIDLFKSEEKFRKLFEEHAATKLIIDPETGNIVEANNAASVFYGYTKEELTAMNINQINMLSSEAIKKEMGEAQTMGRNFFEFRHRLKDGSTKDVAIFTSPIEIEGKEYLHSIIHDITQRKKSEKQLKLLGRAIDQNPVTIVITDTNGDIEYVNPKFTEITGYTSKEVIGKNPRILQSGEQSQEFYKELWNTILSGNDWHGEFHNKKKNGEHYWESAVISPVFDENGEISSFVAVKEDITEKREIINDLIIAKEQAQESDRLKSAFLATMSHELRTPLNAVIGFSGLIDEETPMDQITSFAQMIHNSGNNLLEIVEGILDLTLLESGESKLHLEMFSLSALVENLVSLAKEEQEKANKPQLEIKFISCITDEPSQLYSDPQKITKIFVLLFRNALKFTTSGKIEFGYVIVSEGDTEQIKFFVKDTGIGISENQRLIIFDRFRQAEDSFTRKYGGTGIGLTIAKQTIEMLSGKIWIDSEPGKGSTFYFTIPIVEKEKISKVVTEQKDAAEWYKTFLNQTILIAEDEDSNFQLLKHILMRSNLQIIHAKNGQKAVELCSAHPEIQLVLMDIKMPIMNGYEATRQIRQFNPEVIIIVQTAYALSGDKEKAIEAGCNDYITKPIRKDKLMELVQKYLGNR